MDREEPLTSLDRNGRVLPATGELIMSESPTGEATATDAATTTDQQQPEQPKPTETVDFWKHKAREQERRAKENADARKRLDELEAKNKSEVEKATDARTAAEAERDAARAEALRLRVAAKHGISETDADLFLTGTDEDTLTAQAQRLVALDSERKKNGNYVPREGTQPTTADSDERQVARSLFGGT